MRRIAQGRLASCAGIATLLALVLPLAACGPLDRAELKREVESIGSLASEGELLAAEVARDRTKTTFVRVHAGELESAAQDSAEKLNDATPGAELSDEIERAVRLASDTSDALGQLAVSPGDEATGRSVQLELNRLSNDADDLSSSL